MNIPIPHASIPYLHEGIVFLLSAVVVALMLKKLRLSPVLGYLIAGVAIGPHGLKLITDHQNISSFAQLGVVFLLFIIGLELSFTKLRQMSTLIFGLGSLQVLITGAAIAGVAYLWGNRAEVALLLGISLALSSTSLVVQVLADRGEAASRVGITSFAILLMQDLAVVPLLAIITALGTLGAEASLGEALLVALLKAVGAIAVILIVGRYLCAYPFRWVAALKNQELFIALTLLVILGTGMLTHAAGLSMEMGAFLAGLLLAGTEYSHQIESDIRPFRGLLLGLFFTTVGMSIDFAAVNHQAFWLIASVLGLIALKSSILTVLCLAFRLPLPLAARTGLLLGEAGEFVFIVVAAAVQFKLMPADVGHFMVLVAGLSLLATPLLASLGAFAEHLLQKRLPKQRLLKNKNDETLRNHVVIAGFGRMGKTVARMLASENIPYIGVDNDSKSIAANAKKFHVFFGDATRKDIMEHAGIERAAAVLVTIDSPAHASRCVTTIRQHWPDTKIFARAWDEKEVKQLKASGATEVVQETLESSLSLAQKVFTTIGVPDEVLEAVIKKMRAKEKA